MLEKYHCHYLLEIGVGTGRVSLPLHNSGYETTGIDVSRNMLARAKKKRLPSLLLASGNQVPFKEKSFDGTLTAHVLHVVDDPIAVMKEAGRVSRVGLFALVRKLNEGQRSENEERRERFRRIAEKYGWNSYLTHPARYFRREQEIMARYPPDDLVVVSHTVITRSIEETIARFEKGGFRFTLSMPKGMRKEIVKEMRENAQDWTSRPREEIYQVALWKKETLNKMEVLPARS